MGDKEFKVRDLDEVIRGIILLVPKEDPRDMIRGLEDILDSVLYSAPEGIWMWWEELADYLSIHLSKDLDESWEREIYKLFTCKEVI